MNEHCIFRTRKESIDDCIAGNQGLVVIYGATFWGGILVDEGSLNVDCFCDQKAYQKAYWENTSYYFHGFLVYDVKKLEYRIIQSGKRATIIICIGNNRSTVDSIYKDLLRLDVNADVFNYFENENVFCDKRFSLRGKEYALFEHPYNCGYVHERMTERSVELALAKEYIDKCADDVIEIGAVTPYYFFDDKLCEIIDPTDCHKRVTRKSLFDCDLRGKNVLSISTVEHIGTSDYGMNEQKTVIDAIEKILEESDSCLITAPMGYNSLLDRWVEKNKQNVRVSVLKRSINNHWDEITDEDYIAIEYTPLWANGLVVIEK